MREIEMTKLNMREEKVLEIKREKKRKNKIQEINLLLFSNSGITQNERIITYNGTKGSTSFDLDFVLRYYYLRPPKFATL